MSLPIETWLYTALIFVLTLIVIPFARKLAIKTGFVDNPGGRKTHDEPVPPVGGIVIFSLFLSISLISGTDFNVFWPLYLSLGFLLLMGALDDKHHLPAALRFTAQFAVAFIVVHFGAAKVDVMGNLLGFGDIYLGWFSYPFSMFCIVLLINAVNMMDGLDGLAAGKSFIVISWLVIACFIAGFTAPTHELFIMIGALLGFLFYNMRHPLRDKANIFLGDAGSMCLGLFIGWYIIALSQEPDPTLTPVSVAWIVALPVIDAFGLFLHRIRDGRHPFSPDRNHFHFHFVHAGIPVGKATSLILIIGFIWGAIGYGGILIGISEPVLMYSWIAMLILHTYITLKPQPFIAFLKRLHAIEDKDISGDTSNDSA